MVKKDNFKLIMISAMYENGGNTTHRLFDGHNEIHVYPFESQIGTKFVNDHLSSLFPQKYRWPIFPNSASPDELYEMIIDEECKILAKTPYVSKFKDADFVFSEKGRKSEFVAFLAQRALSRKRIVEAFFVATFHAWENYNRSGKEKYFMGYSPIVGVDSGKILQDFPGEAFILHVVRNPFSAYAETKKRPVPLSMDHYLTGWILCQLYALWYKELYPDRFFIVRYEDIIKGPIAALDEFLTQTGLQKSDTLLYPSWNGKRLTEVYPWGTIRKADEKTNIETARELSRKELREISTRTNPQLASFGYLPLAKKLLKT
ncbi:MAG: sulfotransferase [bacterium]|nr:sulfotransferase [bacterium]